MSEDKYLWLYGNKTKAFQSEIDRVMAGIELLWEEDQDSLRELVELAYDSSYQISGEAREVLESLEFMHSGFEGLGESFPNIVQAAIAVDDGKMRRRNPISLIHRRA